MSRQLLFSVHPEVSKGEREPLRACQPGKQRTADHDAFRFTNAIRNLPPAYFSMVMATGIVSIASHLMGFKTLALGLLWLNVIFYAGLWVLTLLRIYFYPERVVRDLADHLRGVGFFTTIAGTCVLGSQIITILQAYRAALILLVIGVFLWGCLIYGVFTILTVKADKPPIQGGISGLWLVAVVATQSVAVLSALLAPEVPQRTLFLFFSYCMFLIGGMMYIIIITLLFYRFMFFPLDPIGLTPPYWINMGALAISTLSGANLILQSAGVAFLEKLLPMTMGFSLLFWAFGSWWIPFLLLLGAWRYLLRHVPFSYDPQYWGMVFPIGMYTVCTFRLAHALDLPFLLEIPRYSIYAALLAWSLTFAGFLRSVFSGKRRLD